ncbi:MAG: hypothetical protein IKR33_07675 [Bacteroidales bacterium]|nr:hypothetical protein [Bacteroidales bacterium]
MSRHYIISLLAMTLALVLLSFIVMFISPDKWLMAMPFIALYFGIVTGLQHWLVTKAMFRSPKAFVQQFLGTTVGVLFLHLAVMAIYLLTHPGNAKIFTIAFLIGFVVSWVFETLAILMFIKKEKKKREQNG